MAEVVRFLKLVLGVVLKLILIFLKKGNLKSNNLAESNERYACTRNGHSRKRLFVLDESDSTCPTSSTVSQHSFSSGIGSSISSDDDINDLGNKDDVFDEPLQKATQFDAEIERLGLQNMTLRDRLYRCELRSRKRSQLTDVSRVASRTRSLSSVPGCQVSATEAARKHSVCDITRTSTPRAAKSDSSIDDIICGKLMKKLQWEREENRRLHGYINDLIYVVMETRPQLLEK